MADSRVPTTLREFRIELGKAILKDLHDSQVYADSATLEMLLNATPDTHHIEAAVHWCNTHRSRLSGLANIAKQAQQAGERGQFSIMANVVEDQGGCGTFLRSVTPRYFASFVATGMRLEGQDFQSFLALLVQLGG